MDFLKKTADAVFGTKLAAEPLDNGPFNVVILGASYAGAAVAISLDEAFKSIPDVINITLVDPREASHFHHFHGNVRAMVDPSFAERTWIPTKYVFHYTNGKHIQSKAVEIHETSVVLANGTRLSFDFLVIATGGKQGTPIRPAATNIDDGIREMTQYAEAIKASNKILIVGGGPTAIEVAGEIRHVYKDKDITIVHDRPSLIPGPYHDSFRTNVKAALEKRKIRYKVILNESMDLPAIGGPLVQKSRILKSSKGTAIDSDLQICLIGYAGYNSDILLPLGLELLDEKGQIKVLPTLQVQDFKLPHIFALGDVASANVPKQVKYIRQQAVVVSTNIQRLIWARRYYPPTAPADFQAQGRSEVVSLMPYTNSLPEDLLAITLGPDDGIMSTPIFSVGAWGSKMLKGKDLGLVQQFSELNLTYPPEWK
ncbi:hypothetical protein HDU97_007578 [Phlyctochytrium planicorne]|nr:hypothetical protein HDU97_007578 [Phlyctochytrium planicorne]